MNRKGKRSQSNDVIARSSLRRAERSTGSARKTFTGDSTEKEPQTPSGRRGSKSQFRQAPNTQTRVSVLTSVGALAKERPSGRTEGLEKASSKPSSAGFGQQRSSKPAYGRCSRGDESKAGFRLEACPQSRVSAQLRGSRAGPGRHKGIIGKTSPPRRLSELGSGLVRRSIAEQTRTDSLRLKNHRIVHVTGQEPKPPRR